MPHVFCRLDTYALKAHGHLRESLLIAKVVFETRRRRGDSADEDDVPVDAREDPHDRCNFRVTKPCDKGKPLKLTVNVPLQLARLFGIAWPAGQRKEKTRDQG